MLNCYNRSKCICVNLFSKQTAQARAHVTRIAFPVPALAVGTGCGPGLTKQLTISSARAATAQIMHVKRNKKHAACYVPCVPNSGYFYLHVLVAVMS